MKNTQKIIRDPNVPIYFQAVALRGLSSALVACLLMLAPGLVQADVVVTSRLSEISLQSTNLGGVGGNVSTTSLTSTFAELMSGTNTHIEPGGRINTGTWLVSQTSTIADDLITSQGETTTSITGDGSGILIGLSNFEVEFQSVGDNPFELSGSHFGSTSPVGAVDYVHVSLQEFDGVAFQTLFSTTAGDSLNSGSFTGMFDDGGLYRLEVFSRSFTNTNEAFTSGASVSLAVNPIPEPASAAILLGLCLVPACKRRRR
ncbi:MAG: hypothetical protein AAF456_12205 [Planctomycetota bacterium]